VTSVPELERLFFGAWPAAEVLALGDWRLRFTSGVTRRANSVWPGGASGLALDAAIGRAEAFYRARGAPARFQLFPTEPCAALDPALAERGYELESPVSVQLAAASDVARAIGADGAAVEVEERVTPAWWSVAAERSRFAAVPEPYRALLDRIGPRAGFALARLEGEPAASGLGVVDGDFAGIFSMLTLPERRRRGAAQAVLGALARWAERRGAERLALQVERDNPAALALYARAGFREIYGYHYRLARAR
jgi:ribosomal protein S18 acetylase RimI-like enzyme